MFNDFLLRFRFRLLLASSFALTLVMSWPDSQYWPRGIAVILLVLAGLNTLRHKQGLQWMTILLGALNMLLMVLDDLQIISRMMSQLGLIALYLALCFALIRRVTHERPVTGELLYGLCALYLQLALAFAVGFTTIEALAPGAFASSSSGPLQLADFTYFSLVTLTTMGYGDIYPIHPAARILASIEGVVGVLFIALAVARSMGLINADSSNELS